MDIRMHGKAQTASRDEWSTALRWTRTSAGVHMISMNREFKSIAGSWHRAWMSTKDYAQRAAVLCSLPFCLLFVLLASIHPVVALRFQSSNLDPCLLTRSSRLTLFLGKLLGTYAAPASPFPC